MSAGDFPVDDVTLDMVMAAIEGRGSERASLADLLDMMDGYDAVAARGGATEIEPGVWDCTSYDRPSTHPNTVIAALITEIRRLRAAQPNGAP